ncbi:MAG: hypothetical protein ACKVT0_16310 [Planctomycetaceae bacterium]
MKHLGLVLIIIFSSLSGSATLHSADESKPHRPHPFGQREHVVWRMNDETEPTSIPAEIQWVSEPWFREKPDENAQMPYLTYLPEQDRVLMLVETHQPIRTAFIHSDDHGGTWSERTWLSTDADGQPAGVALGLTNLGGGKLLAYPENLAHGKWVSDDYGQSWKFLPVHDIVKTRYMWDPLLVQKDKNGKVPKLIEASYRETGVPWGSPDGYYSQAYFRTSVDEGATWNDEVKVPQWLGVNEVNLIRASNGDLVAACRTDYPSRFAHLKLDHFGGLAVSISQDDGKTWSKLNPLYEWGRHHPSQVLMPNGDLLMTYVVRLGYPATWTGIPQFGVEAVISHDHGQTWDKARRYILASWEGNIVGDTAWFCGVQSTTTILLPDGMLLTAFGTGFRNPADTKICKMDVALVRWKLE